MHLAPTASRRVYQQRIGRIMRMHPRKEAGIVVDFVPKAATHNERVVSLHSLLDADFYREGPRHPGAAPARAAPCPPPPIPGTVARAGDARRGSPPRRDPAEWQRIDPKYLDDEQRFWATIAGRQIRFDQRAEFARKFAEAAPARAHLETFLAVCAAENPNRRLRMTALADRVATPVERADFDDLVTLVTQAPPWEKDRGGRPRASARDRRRQGGRTGADPGALDVKLARATRKIQDRRASQEFPEAKRLLGAVANSRGHRHEENVGALVKVAKALPLPVGAALLASAEGYTPRANALLDRPVRSSARSRRSRTGSPRTCRCRSPRPRSRRRRRKRKQAPAPSRRKRSRRPSPSPRPSQTPRLRSKTRRPSGRYADGSSSSFFSRSRRKRVSSAAIESPDGSSSSWFQSSRLSARRSSSSTYAAVSGSDATASLTCSA